MAFCQIRDCTLIKFKKAADAVFMFYRFGQGVNLQDAFYSMECGHDRPTGFIRCLFSVILCIFAVIRFSVRLCNWRSLTSIVPLCNECDDWWNFVVPCSDNYNKNRCCCFAEAGLSWDDGAWQSLCRMAIRIITSVQTTSDRIQLKAIRGLAIVDTVDTLELRDT